MRAKSFQQFLLENRGSTEDFINDLALKLIERIRRFDEETEDYISFAGMTFNEPFYFDLIVKLRKDPYPDFKTDARFKELPWEKINFREKGYAIDAIARIESDKPKPEIIMYLLIDSKQEPHLYQKLYYRLVDILAHETNHLDQASEKDTPFNANPSDQKKRNQAKKSYQYFLLPDEIESMVEGIYARAKLQKIELDLAIDDYLRPLVISKYITPQEYQRVLVVWVKHALENYPDAKFSSKVEQIVNSI